MIIRDIRDTDRAFVLDSWWRSWCDDFCRSYRIQDFGVWIVGEGMIGLVRALIDARGVRVRVACDDDDTDTIAGWAVTQDGVGLWGFVKIPLRRTGVWAALAADAEVKAFAIRSSAALRWGLCEGLAYEPEMIMRRAP